MNLTTDNSAVLPTPRDHHNTAVNLSARARDLGTSLQPVASSAAATRETDALATVGFSSGTTMDLRLGGGTSRTVRPVDTAEAVIMTSMGAAPLAGEEDPCIRGAVAAEDQEAIMCDRIAGDLPCP